MAMTSGNNKEDASSVLAEFFKVTEYDSIPGEVMSTVKKSILDTLGVSIAATSLVPGCKKLAELGQEGGGKEESTVLVFGGRVPAWMAAFVNGSLSHALDFDNIHNEVICHPSGVVLPAAFAIAERSGPVSGKDFITAVALGQETAIRMIAALHRPMLLYNWIPFPVTAIFAAAAACGKLLGLNQDEIQASISIALCYSAGAGELMQSNFRGFYNAWPAKGSVFSALMAEKGIIGPMHPLDGDQGFFHAYYRGEYDRNVLLADLGKKFYSAQISYKAWPSCASTQPSIDATLGLIRDHRIRPEDIQQINVFGGSHARQNCEPLEEKQKPKTPLEAQFSVPFTVALAATKGEITLGDFTSESIRDPAVLELACKVVPAVDPELDTKRGTPPAIVEIKTKTDQKYSRRTDFVYGHFRNPMNMDAIIDKFRSCASYSAKPLPEKNLTMIVDLVNSLEEVEDVSQIVRLLG